MIINNKNIIENFLPPIDKDKMKMLFDIKMAYKEGELSAEQAQKLIKEKIGKVSPYHIAYIEQTMTEETDDECIREDMHSMIHMLDGCLDNALPQLDEEHPIMHYLRENKKMKELLKAVEDLVQYPIIKNQWIELYEQINLYIIHYQRKQNQLYPILEQKGFMRPSTTMWTFDDIIKDIIKTSWKLLNEDKEKEFINNQTKLVELTRDLMEKEEYILYPTSLALISPEEFEEMKQGDQEIGFAFIKVEKYNKQCSQNIKPQENNSFANELQSLLVKYGYQTNTNQLLDVCNGKLTLQQINLIYKHLPIDISFVDENELVKFYSDTDHRIFPRSKNVIGREVMNCHPKKSAHIVREILDKLKSGEQEKAEFWINKPNLFIYILYVAVKDEMGNFKGVIEIMQDCTHIRNLEGSQTLLTWNNQQHSEITQQNNKQ